MTKSKTASFDAIDRQLADAETSASFQVMFCLTVIFFAHYGSQKNPSLVYVVITA